MNERAPTVTTQLRLTREAKRERGKEGEGEREGGKRSLSGRCHRASPLSPARLLLPFHAGALQGIVEWRCDCADARLPRLLPSSSSTSTSSSWRPPSSSTPSSHLCVLSPSPSLSLPRASSSALRALVGRTASHTSFAVASKSAKTKSSTSALTAALRC